MNQTATRTETKKRDSALLSGTKPRLPPLASSEPGKPPAGGRQPVSTGRQQPTTRSKATSNGPRARSGRPDLETGGRVVSGKVDTARARSRSSKPDLSTGMRTGRADTTSKPAVKPVRTEDTRAKKSAGVVNRAAPSKTLAGTVKRATLANAGQLGS